MKTRISLRISEKLFYFVEYVTFFFFFFFINNSITSINIDKDEPETGINFLFHLVFLFFSFVIIKRMLTTII